MALTLAELMAPETAAQCQADLLAELANAGLPTLAWQGVTPGSPSARAPDALRRTRLPLAGRSAPPEGRDSGEEAARVYGPPGRSA